MKLPKTSIIFARNISMPLFEFLIAFAQNFPLLLPKFREKQWEIRAKAMGNSGKSNGKIWAKAMRKLGGAVVYWIEPLTLNQRVPGSIPVRTSALLSFSKALYPHCCSPPRCINGYPVGCEWDYVSYCLSPFYRLTLWKLPRELRLRTISAVLNSIHWPG